MDALATEGAIFTNAYAEYPVTVPTRTALVAGIYTFTNHPWTALRPYDLHVAELFREAGYRTVAFTDSPFRSVIGMDRGFHEFFEYPSKLQPATNPPEGSPDLKGAVFPPGSDDEQRLWRNYVEGYLDEFPRKYGRIGVELLVDEACGWLQRHTAGGSEPFFLWLDTFQPHEPWAPPAPYDTMYQAPGYEGPFIPMPPGPSVDWMSPEEIEHVKALYMGEVTYTDEHLGRLMQTVDELGLVEDTLVVLLSDHGQPFGDHGTIRKFGVPLYEELSKIVWIVRKPGLIDPGQRLSAFAETPDLLPTLVDLCGLPEPQPRKVWAGRDASTGMDGVSLAPVLRGENDSTRDTIYLGAFGLRAGIRTGDWKLIDNRGEKPNELYDLASDPLERNNLWSVEPDRAAEMHRRLWEFCSRWSAILAWRDRPAQPDPDS